MRPSKLSRFNTRFEIEQRTVTRKSPSRPSCTCRFAFGTLLTGTLSLFAKARSAVSVCKVNTQSRTKPNCAGSSLWSSMMLSRLTSKRGAFSASSKNPRKPCQNLLSLIMLWDECVGTLLQSIKRHSKSTDSVRLRCNEPGKNCCAVDGGGTDMAANRPSVRNSKSAWRCNFVQ